MNKPNQSSKKHLFEGKLVANKKHEPTVTNDHEIVVNTELMANPDDWVISNYIKTNRVHAAEGLTRARTGLINAGIELLEAQTDANNIEQILEAKTVNTEAELDEAYVRRDQAERQAKEKEEQDEISSLENKLKLAQLKKALKNEETPPHEQTPAEYREELARKRDINKANSEDWAERNTQRATGKFNTIKKLDEACRQKLKEMVEKAVLEGWDAETIEEEGRHIRAYFENEKNRVD